MSAAEELLTRGQLPACIVMACARGHQAHKVYLDLVMEGIDVRSIDFTARAPVLTVTNTPQLKKLLGPAVMASSNLLPVDGALVWRATFKDCVLQWKGN